jgi:hydrogenase-4 component B
MDGYMPFGLLAVLFLGFSVAGIVSALLSPERRVALSLGCFGGAASIAMGAIGASAIISSVPSVIPLWFVPTVGPLILSVDKLSGLFLLVSAFVFLTTSIYSVEYLQPYLKHFSLRSLSVCYFAILLAVGLVLSAGDALTFLVSWELMSLFGYALVNYQKRDEQSVAPGYLMLVMGEAGFVAVVLAFLVIAGRQSHTLLFSSLSSRSASLGSHARWTVFLLSFFGFGVKTGLAPFNRWLPKAHPIAPANVSAILSGALLNLGIYGIIRFNADLVPVATAGPGLVVLLIGAFTALMGIMYANRDNDMKEMLANSSIENMGIITTALGAGLVFMALHEPVLAGIAWIAGFYQMTNHSVYKSLLFFGAGAIDRNTGTRLMDRLGGLSKHMPLLAPLFLAGALSICALPPMNGFVSEWLTLQCLLQSSALSSRSVRVLFALAGAGLALTAGLAVTCFVKAYAMTFLGVPRSDQARQSARVRFPIRLAMGLGAVSCLLLGVLPTYVITILGRVSKPLTGVNAAAALVPPFFNSAPGHSSLPQAFLSDFHSLGAQIGQRFLPAPGLVVLHRGHTQNPVVFAMSTSYMLVVLIVLAGGLFLAVRFVLARRSKSVKKPVWAGGLASLLPELTYSATGFSSPVRVTFNAVFHPQNSEERLELIAGHFRNSITRVVGEVHVFDRVLFQPLVNRATQIARTLSRMHHGRLNAYSAYVLGTLFVVLLLSRTQLEEHVVLSPALILIVALILDRLL